MNDILAIVIFSAFIGGMTIAILYRFIALFQKNTKTCLIISLIYGFSFSAIVFNCGIELYNVATLSILFLWYQVSKIIKNKLASNTFIILYVAGILTASITITNYAIFLIACLILLISKKVSFKKLLLINITVIVSLLGLSFYQQAVWHSSPTIIDSINPTGENETTYINLDISPQNIKNVIKDDYYNSFISSRPQLPESHKIISFSRTSLLSLIFSTVMFAIILLFFFWHRHSDKLLNLGFILTLAFYTCLHIIYGNDGTYLYSLNFVLPIICLLGINFVSIKKKSYKPIVAFFILYLVLEVLFNIRHFFTLMHIIGDVANPNIFREKMGLPILLLIIFIIILLISTLSGVIIYNIKKLWLNYKDHSSYAQNIIAIIAGFLAISTIFIGIETTSHYYKFFWFDLRPINFQKSSEVSNVLNKETYDTYKKNVSLYQKEFEEYKDKLQANSTNTLPETPFYEFGSNSSNKLFYTQGKLIDIYSGKTIAQFDVADQLIIPSEKLVFLNLWNQRYVIIKEDNQGVHILEDGYDGLVNTDALNNNLRSF